MAYLRSQGGKHNPEHQIHRLEADTASVGSGPEVQSRTWQSQRRTVLLHDTIKRRLALPCQYGATDHEALKIMAAIESFRDGAEERDWREHILIVAGLVIGIAPWDMV